VSMFVGIDVAIISADIFFFLFFTGKALNLLNAPNQFNASQFI